MADAKALFKRHWEQLRKIEIEPDESPTHATIIYAACIIAEAMRIELDDDDSRYIPGLHEQKNFPPDAK